MILESEFKFLENQIVILSISTKKVLYIKSDNEIIVNMEFKINLKKIMVLIF